MLQKIFISALLAVLLSISMTGTALSQGGMDLDQMRKMVESMGALEEPEKSPVDANEDIFKGLDEYMKMMQSGERPPEALPGEKGLPAADLLKKWEIPGFKAPAGAESTYEDGGYRLTIYLRGEDNKTLLKDTIKQLEGITGKKAQTMREYFDNPDFSENSYIIMLKEEVFEQRSLIIKLDEEKGYIELSVADSVA